MPELPSKDVAHTQSTDHRILRSPATLPPESATSVHEAILEAFPTHTAALLTNRDLGLAWETLAERGVSGAAQKSGELLRKALKETPDDPRLLLSYAFVEQKHGKQKEALDLYQHVLRLRPSANTAATNLGILEAQSDV